ncbi:MAG: hypothetical protein IPI37_04735 [Bacteroidales bacterium]|nr:hypothetical protein [Bacteroidales bacterium]
MRYRPRDKWSFIADYEEFHGFKQGQLRGSRNQNGLDNANNVRVVSLYEGL